MSRNLAVIYIFSSKISFTARIISESFISVTAEGTTSHYKMTNLIQNRVNEKKSSESDF